MSRSSNGSITLHPSPARVAGKTGSSEGAAGMLLFKKKFLPAIRAGDKTQTIRLWKWRMMRAGQRSYIPGAGYIRIDGVQEVAIDDLTDADALPDGFATAAALQAELQDIYGEKVAAGYKAFRVTFHLATEGDSTAKSSRGE
ncbi:MAG: ASCH domain-containing protein [Planctomycetales bacterium]|nr:ASCH domain-containing protein [Planctomycetales bacterium]